MISTWRCVEKYLENKFLEIYGSGENFSVGIWKKKINFINLLVEKGRK